MKLVEAVAKQKATPSPGMPMSRKSFKVPRQPSRQSMKAMRKATAQSERQNTTVQLSPAWMKRAMVPPKLHISADRKTSSMPNRSSRGETAGKATRGEAVSVMDETVSDLRVARSTTDDQS